MAPPDFGIDGKDRLIVLDAFGLDNPFDLIVEDVMLAIENDHQDGMTDLQVEVLDRHHAHLFVGETELSQGQVLGNERPIGNSV